MVLLSCLVKIHVPARGNCSCTHIRRPDGPPHVQRHRASFMPYYRYAASTSSCSPRDSCTGQPEGFPNMAFVPNNTAPVTTACNYRPAYRLRKHTKADWAHSTVTILESQVLPCSRNGHTGICHLHQYPVTSKKSPAGICCSCKHFRRPIGLHRVQRHRTARTAVMSLVPAVQLSHWKAPRTIAHR